MANFKVQKFNGMAPAISPRLLSNNFAQSASEVDFVSGQLEPSNADSTLGTSSSNTGTVKTLHSYEYELQTVGSTLDVEFTPAVAGVYKGAAINVYTNVPEYGTLDVKVGHGFNLKQIYFSDTVMYLVTNTPASSSPGPTWFGTGTIDMQFSTASFGGTEVSNGPAITNVSNAALGQAGGEEFFYLDFGSVQYWFKDVGATAVNAIQTGVKHFVRFSNAATAAVTTVLGTTSKTFVYKAAPLVDLQNPPAKYINFNYYGEEDFLLSEYIKVPTDKRSIVKIGGTLSGGNPTRTAEVTYVDYDGVDTIIFFRRDHFITSGTHTAAATSQTVLTDSSLTAYETSNSLQGYALSYFGDPERTIDVISSLSQSTGYVSASGGSNDTVTVQDLYTGDTTQILDRFTQNGRYIISAEPNVSLHTANNSEGSYWNKPGIEACFSGFFNSAKILKDASKSVNFLDGASYSGATKDTGLGYEPYFVDRSATIITQSMLRGATSNGDRDVGDGNHTAGETVDGTYSSYAYQGPIQASGSTIGSSGNTNCVLSLTGVALNANDDAIGWYLWNLNKGSKHVITDSVDGTNSTFSIGEHPSGSEAHTTGEGSHAVGDRCIITKSPNIYDFEWRCFHKDHPLSKIAGQDGNMGVVLANVEALTADHVQNKADKTGTDAGDPSANNANGAAKITLTEGDIVQFGGWGVDTKRMLMKQAENQTTGEKFVGTNLSDVVFEARPHVNSVLAGETDSDGDTAFTDRAFFRPSSEMNFDPTPGSSGLSTQESHSTGGCSSFEARHGGPYWQVVGKSIKCSVANGIITILGANKSIVTGVCTNGSSQDATFEDAFKNFESNASYLVGGTLVNVTRGWSATITSNTFNTFTFGSAKFYNLSNVPDFYEHIASRQGSGSTASTGGVVKAVAGDHYYIAEAIPGITSISGVTLTEEFFNFRAISLASLDTKRHIYTDINPQRAVWWYASRRAATNVSYISGSGENSNKLRSYLEFTSDAKIKNSPVISDKFDRLYWTGEEYPKMAGANPVTKASIIPSAKAQNLLIPYADWSGAGKEYRLGVPSPKRAVTVNQSFGEVSALRDVSEVLNVSYVYTFVTAYGEEGPPSPPSDVVNFEFGQQIVLSNIGIESNELTNNTEYAFGINSGALKRIYRSNTGSTDTQFQFVDEIPFSRTFYVDSKDPAHLAEVLPSSGWDGPPNDDENLYPSGPMQGLVELPNGVFAGFTGDRLCFSESYLPHAWPISYRRTVEDEILALGAVSNGVFVLTKGKPYFFAGSDASVMAGQQIDFAQACINTRSVVDMGDSIYYAGPDGLCAISTNSAEIITKGLITPKQWINDFQASTYLASRHENKYVAFYNALSSEGDGFMVDGSDPEGALVELNRSTAPSVLFNEEGTDTLFTLEGQTLKEFRGGTGIQTYSWKSKKFTTSGPVSMSWLYIHADSYPGYTGTFPNGAVNAGLEVTLTTDGTDIFKAKLGKVGNEYIQETSVPGSIPDTKLYQAAMRLPAHSAIEFEILITGTVPVNEVSLTQSMTELIES